MANVKIEAEPVEKMKLDEATLSAVADKLKRSQVDPARIVAVISKLKQTNPDDAHDVVVSTLKELGSNPALVATVIERIKTVLPPKAGMVDPATAAAVITAGVEVINKLNVGGTTKSLLIKLAIYLFGIFCGIGIVYKSGLPLPADKATPPANVSVYQKRIEELTATNVELQQENDQLRRGVNPPGPLPVPPVDNEPPVWPPPRPVPFPTPKLDPVPVVPPTTIPAPRPGFIVK